MLTIAACDGVDRRSASAALGAAGSDGGSCAGPWQYKLYADAHRAPYATNDCGKCAQSPPPTTTTT